MAAYGNEKVRALREWFDLSNSEYERLLAQVLELPSAKEYDEALVTSAKRWRAGERWFHERQQGSDAP